MYDTSTTLSILMTVEDCGVIAASGGIAILAPKLLIQLRKAVTTVMPHICLKTPCPQHLLVPL